VQQGWKGFPVSEATVYNNLYLAHVQPVWYMARHGFGAWKNKYEHTMLRYAPTVPNALWVGDDTKVNLYYKDRYGVQAQLNVYAIVDAGTKCWLGWSFAENKKGKDVDTETVKAAYRHALIRTGGAVPYQMQYDNDKANAFYKRLNTLNFPCMPNNGQSKIIERLFGKLQRNFMRFDKAFTGQNVQSTSLQSKVNAEAVQIYASKEDAMKAQELWFLTMNNTKNAAGHTPHELQQAVVEGTLYATDHDFMELFWEWNEGNNTYRKEGITMLHNKQTYVYHVGEPHLPNLEFLEANVGARFKIRYNPADLSEVALYTAKDLRYIAKAVTKDRMPMAVYDYQPNSKAHIAANLSLKKEQRKRNKDQFAIAQEVSAEAVLNAGHVYFDKAAHNLAEAQLYAENIKALPPEQPLNIEQERRQRMRRAD
jgi:hypothetical protein